MSSSHKVLGRIRYRTDQGSRVNTLLLALGANMPGPWGSPRDTLVRAQHELAQAGLRIVRASGIYATTPLGSGRQARYLNAVLLLRGPVAPAALLRLVKRIERSAGRRMGRHWGPRCLDIDVLDHGGRRLGWPPRRRERGRLILPHPEMHGRAFVLVPLLEVDRHWRHPVLGASARMLLDRLGYRGRSGIRQTLDFVGPACDKGAR
jgi:2-amino-4-hydroxy-6-hydroxymethyldihydropteridine diphosphokinase